MADAHPLDDSCDLQRRNHFSVNYNSTQASMGYSNEGFLSSDLRDSTSSKVWSSFDCKVECRKKLSSKHADSFEPCQLASPTNLYRKPAVSGFSSSLSSLAYVPEQIGALQSADTPPLQQYDTGSLLSHVVLEAVASSLRDWFISCFGCHCSSSVTDRTDAEHKGAWFDCGQVKFW